MRSTVIIVMGLALVGCNSTTPSSQAGAVPASTNSSRFERAKEGCYSRAGTSHVMAGQYWIAGTAAANHRFRVCMAEQGFVIRA
ncbi:hypothetical protein ASC90_26955 [Rhizobium sp. Root1220]|nr:hypothetical protein ASC90_26955 [Rhizobium sp. Root1220]